MGIDIHVEITKYNKDTNYYEPLQLYRLRKENEKFTFNPENGEKVPIEDKYIEVYPYTQRNTEMFEGMKNGDSIDGYGCFPWSSVAFNSLEPSYVNELRKKTASYDYFDFHEITLAEFKVYTLEHPRVTDYDIDNELFEECKKRGITPKKKNPLCDLFEDLCNYCKLTDNWDWNFDPLSYYKVIFYFDN